MPTWKCLKCDELRSLIIKEIENHPTGTLSFRDANSKMRGFCQNQTCVDASQIPQFSKGYFYQLIDEVKDIAADDTAFYTSYAWARKRRGKQGRSSDYRDVQTYSYPAHVLAAAPPNPVLNPAVVKQLTDVLSSHFTNGFRLNSPIEMARFRSFAAEDLDEEITLADEELKSFIAACGTTFDGKIYAVSAQAKERIKGLAEDYFADGAQAIFFAEFYAKNENFGNSLRRMSMSISSEITLAANSQFSFLA